MPGFVPPSTLEPRSPPAGGGPGAAVDPFEERLGKGLNTALAAFALWFVVANLQAMRGELGADPAAAPLASAVAAARPDGPVPPGVGAPPALALPAGRWTPRPAVEAGVPSPAPQAPDLAGLVLGAASPRAPRPVAPVAPPRAPGPTPPAAADAGTSAAAPGAQAAAPGSPAAADRSPPPEAPPRPPGPGRLLEVAVRSSEAGYALHLRFDRPLLVRSSFQEGSRTLEATIFPLADPRVAARIPPLAFLESVDDAGSGRRAALRLRLARGAVPRRPLPVGELDELVLAFRVGDQGPGLPPGATLHALADHTVAPGLVERRYRYTPASAEGSDVYTFEVDLASGGLELGVTMGGASVLGKETTSSMARSVNALAAINASFFSRNGDPLGLLSRDGGLVSMPLMSRGVLGVFEGGRRVLVGNPGYSGRVDLPFGSLPLDGVNQVRKAGKVVLYSPDWGEATGNPGGGLELAVVDGRVTNLADGNLEIPADGYVVAVEGGEAQRMLSAIGMGDTVSLVSGLTPPWDRADLALGGGPVLLRSGRPDVRWQEEGFSRAFAAARAPRTAVGVRGDGTVVLVVVDGRKPGVNRGVDLFELGDLLAELGCREGLNLDGGGSTTLVRDGRVQNRPSDGSERRVSTALVVTPRVRYAGAPGRIAGG